MPDDGVVDKVAARLTLDISPAQKSLLQLSKDYQDAMKSMSDADKTASTTNLEQTTEKKRALSAKQQEALNQIQQDGELKRQIMTNVNYQAMIQMQQDYNIRMTQIEADNQAARDVLIQQSGLRTMSVMAESQAKIESGQKLADQRLEQQQETHLQKMTQSQQLYEERMAQLQARGASNSNKTSTNKSAQTSAPSFGIFDISKMMVEFAGLNEVMSNLQAGFVDIDKSAAGLKQVFADDTQTQQQLNQVTNDFIAIAKQYGETNTEVSDAAKLWGRQYKDVETAITLTRNATVLATVDNLSMADSNRAVEATMNAMNMKVTDAASAYASSMKIVDSWSALAHEASVSANDLAQGVERSAGAAYQAGLNLDQLNALTAVGVRNTGLDGANIGNALKTILTNISVASPKVQEAFDHLGISMTTMGADGVKSMKPVWELINELSAAAKTSTTADAEWFKAISGGVLQVGKLEAILRDTDQITKVYNESLNSNGKAQQLVQDQLHTVQAELTRLSDTIQQVAHDAESNGLGDVFKFMIVDLTNLINGLSELPKGLDITLASFAGLAVAVRVFSGVVGGLKTITENLQLVWKSGQAIKAKTIAMLGQETVATTSSTAALTAKTVATEATTVADGEQAVAAGVATAAIEAETVAAGEATASFITLDVVTGGIAVVVGLAATALGISAIAMGANKTKADELKQSTSDLNNQMAQMVQSSQSNGTQLVQNVNSLQDIKQAYDNAKKAMDSSKEGTDQYKQAQSQMSEIQRELIGLVGDQEAAQIIASQNIVDAINQEIQAKINLQLVEDQSTIDALTQEQTKTQATISETEKRIKAYQDFADSQEAIAGTMKTFADQSLAAGSIGGPELSQRFQNEAKTYDKSAKDNLDAAATDQQVLAQQQAQAAQQAQQAKALKDQLAQDQQMLEALKANPNAKFGNITPISTGSSTTSAFVKPYQDAITAMNEQLRPYQNNVKDLDSIIKSLTSQQTDYSNAIKYGATQMAIASQAAQNYKDRVSALKTEQDALHQTNDQIRADMDKVASQLYALNPSGADVTKLTDGQQQAISALTNQYDQLNSQLDQNSTKWEEDQRNITSATLDYLNALVQLNTNGMKPLTDSIKTNGRELKEVQNNMNLLVNEITKFGEDTGKQTQVMADYNREVELLSSQNNLLHQSNLQLASDNEGYRQKIEDLKSQYEDGTITQEAYTAGVQLLNDKIQQNTDTMAQNSDQWYQNIDAIQSAIDKVNQMNFDTANNSIKDVIKNLKQMKTDALQPLDDQIKSIDRQLSDMQFNNQTEDNNAKLAKLQTDAAKWKDSTSVEGRKKYQDYLTQIADLQKTMSRDNAKHDLDTKKQGLEDQKTAVEKHFTDLENIYSGFSDNMKSIGDTLNVAMTASAKETSDQIKKILNDDTIKQIKKDLDDTIKSMQTLQGQMISTPAQSVDRNSEIALVKKQMDANSNEWLTATPDRQKQLHDQNMLLGKSIGATYDASGNWTFPKFKNGGQVPGNGGIDSVPAWMTPGEIVVPSFDDLMKTVNNHSSQSTVINMDGAFNGAVFKDKATADYAVDKLGIMFERKTTSRLRSQGIR